MAWYFISAQSDKALDVPGGSADDGLQIQQYGLNGGANQQWEIINLYDTDSPPQGFGAVPCLIVNVQTSKALDDWLASTDDGNPIRQFRAHGGPNQRWYIKYGPATDARFVIINKLSKKVLDVSGASMNDGAGIIQYQEHDGLNQQWMIQDVNTRESLHL